MSIYTHNWESVMNLNRMLNIDKKTIKKNKKRKKQIKKQKMKNVFLYNTIHVPQFS